MINGYQRRQVIVFKRAQNSIGIRAKCRKCILVLPDTILQGGGLIKQHSLLTSGRVVGIGILIEHHLDQIDIMMCVQLLKQRFALWNGFYLAVGDAKGLRQESKVRVDEVTIDESLVILLLLVLADKAHGLIIDDYDSERYFVVNGSHYFHCAHLESAIPDQCKNGAFNLEPGADCSGNGMPQRRHAGVGVEPVTLPDAIKVLRENDVVIE